MLGAPIRPPLSAAGARCRGASAGARAQSWIESSTHVGSAGQARGLRVGETVQRGASAATRPREHPFLPAPCSGTDFAHRAAPQSPKHDDAQSMTIIRLPHRAKGCRGVLEEAPPAAIPNYNTGPGCGLPRDPSVRASCVSHHSRTQSAPIRILWDERSQSLMRALWAEMAHRAVVQGLWADAAALDSVGEMPSPPSTQLFQRGLAGIDSRPAPRFGGGRGGGGRGRGGGRGGGRGSGLGGSAFGFNPNFGFVRLYASGHTLSSPCRPCAEDDPSRR